MFKPINVSIDGGRLTTDFRSHVFEGKNPRISWGAVGSGFQSAFRIAFNAKNYSYDTDWVSSRTQEYTFDDTDFPIGKKVAFTLMIRDNNDNLSDKYDSYIFGGDTEWDADVITGDDDKCVKLFTKQFECKGNIVSAYLYANAAGYYRISINGETVDKTAHLEPAFTNFDKTRQYGVYDVTKFINKENNVTAEVARGWRNKDIRFNDDYDGGAPSFSGISDFSAIIKIEYSDGSCESEKTDGSWKFGTASTTYADIFNGTVYDANNAYKELGFAQVISKPDAVYRPMLIPPVREHEIIAPVMQWAIGDTVYMDFGRNIAGVCRIDLPELDKNQKIVIRHAEELDEDGTLYTAPLRRAAVTDTYIASGDENDLNVWQPEFTYHGFRYISVSGLGTAIDSGIIKAVELRTDIEKHSKFVCGDATATKIHEICLNTERANQHSILTDCPQRDERMGWMNDATSRFEETPYSFEIGRMFPKIVRDLIDEQGKDGAITCTAPFVFGNRPADPVCSSFLVAGIQALLHENNVSIIKEAFPSFEAWENCLMAHSTDLIVDYTYYGDWAGPAYACIGGSIGDGAFSSVTPGEFMSTGYSFFNCKLLANMAAAIGDAAAVEKWTKQGEAIRKAIIDKWYDAETGKMATGSMACQTFAVWLGVLDGTEAKKAVEVLKNDLIEADYQFTTGNLCTRYMPEVLAKFGYIDVAWKMITKTTYPSWGYMLQQEATTVWERFELKKAPGMNSHDHPMYAAIDYWFYSVLCGIVPTKPGFEEVSIKPYMPENLLSAQATVDTVKGDISVRWFKRYDQTHLHVSVPFGVTANIDFNGVKKTITSGFADITL